jgi:hypothetical protein
MNFKKCFRLAILSTAVFLTGCGVRIPQIQEFWEGVDVTGEMEFRIKQNIFCEVIDAIRLVRASTTVNGKAAIPNSYGVQMQISLTVDEVGAFNPSVSLNHTLPNAVASAVSVPQSFNVNAATTVSTDATRTDTSYSYYNVGKIAAPGANSWCHDPDQPLDHSGSSPLLRSNLGIGDYLQGAVAGADILHSSVPAKGGAGKTAKLDVYSYEIKFVVVTNGSITPTWKLVNVSANTGNLPLVNAGRTRTHDLTLTFGPGTDTPADFALQAHFTGQIVQSNRQLRRGMQ